MSVRISRRAQRVSAPTYADVPLDRGDVDLRADNCPPPSWLQDRHAATPAADLTSYGPIAGLPALRRALGAVFSVPSEAVVITTGASEALHLALTCVADPGDAVALPRPAFPGYDEVAALLGLRIVPYDASGPTEPSHRASDGVPPGEQQSVVARIICSPHNPTGATTTRVGDCPDESRTWTIWDLSHAALPAISPAISGPLGMFQTGLRDNEILVFSLSKLLRLPGARIGCLVAADPQVVDTVTRVKTHLSMSTSRPSQLLASRLLDDPHVRHDIAAHHEALAHRRDALQRAVQASTGLRAPQAAGGSHLLLYSIEQSDPWKILKSVGLVGLPGTMFHSAEPAVRICTAQPEDIVQAAAERIAAL